MTTSQRKLLVDPDSNFTQDIFLKEREREREREVEYFFDCEMLYGMFGFIIISNPTLLPK
jgi:hypothetical protein